MLAPVVLFVYKRPEHTQKVLEGLSHCDLANQTDVIIYADGAKKEASQGSIEKIKLVRNLLSEYERNHTFASFQIINSEVNKGLASSVKSGISEQINKHGKVIVLEDDIVPIKTFLTYTNRALELYENEERVWGISAYAYPLAKPDKVKENHFFLPVNSSWGWATWKRAWRRVEFDIEVIWRKFKENKITPSGFNFGSYYYYEILEAQKEGKIDSWAAYFNASMFLRKGLFVFPKYSQAKNIGFDNSGTHTQIEDMFFDSSPKVLGSLEFLAVSDSYSGRKEVERAFEQQFGRKSLLRRISNKLNPKSPYFLLKTLKNLVFKFSN